VLTTHLARAPDVLEPHGVDLIDAPGDPSRPASPAGRMERPPPEVAAAGDRRIHSIPLKFAAVLGIATGWTGLSIWISQPWLRDLAAVTGLGFALLTITFIAYIPGFMNAFVFATLALDRRPKRVRPATYPPISILVAAYNEADGIGDALQSLAAQDYRGPFEILLLNDGSTDDTMAVARRRLAELRFPAQATVRLLDFPVNAGKAAVLNRGLAAATHDLIVTIDGDSWIHPDGLSHLVERLLSDPPETAAVAGAVMVRNSRETFLTRAQEWDYFHGIAAVKRMQSMFHGTLVAQGAFSIYRRHALAAIGGWPACVGEDIVVSWGLLKRGDRIGYAEDAIAFTNVPTRLAKFAQQRRRWSRGLIEAFKAHGALLFKRHLRTIFIWWNLCFPPMDLVYTFVFIPGLVLAAFGKYYIAGPLTLAVMPLAALWNLAIFRVQRRTFHAERLKVRGNLGGFLFYALAYNLLVQPICVLGYAAELAGLRKTWGTK
jgi:biofilm PGA synthesis N-glycosyltransferase PgaC